MTRFKPVALRIALYGIGVVTGIGLFLLSSILLGLLFGFPPGYALYNGYLFAIALWAIVSLAVYFVTRARSPIVRWNLAALLAGVVTFPLVGGVSVLMSTPQFLMFWTH